MAWRVLSLQDTIIPLFAASYCSALLIKRLKTLSAFTKGRGMAGWPFSPPGQAAWPHLQPPRSPPRRAPAAVASRGPRSRGAVTQLARRAGFPGPRPCPVSAAAPPCPCPAPAEGSLLRTLREDAPAPSPAPHAEPRAATRGSHGAGREDPRGPGLLQRLGLPKEHSG